MAYDKVVDSVVLNGIFADIGDAIRSKTGKTEMIDVNNMSSEIISISSGETYYKCFAVDEDSKTWSGYKLIPIEKEKEVDGVIQKFLVYYVEEEPTTGLSYICTPKIDCFYNLVVQILIFQLFFQN